MNNNGNIAYIHELYSCFNSPRLRQAHMIERIHLAILREIDRHGTLTEAANQLCLTQSALSHGIKKLEQQLAVKLWVKDGRRLRLTSATPFTVARR